MARRKREKTPIQIESITHEDKRANIPTEELRDFVVDDEKAPQTTLYPRDPSLDPQLVWQGKDEQDAEDLEVESVPIYIQEKIYPQAIIEDVRRQSQTDNPDDQLDFFSDFNGIEFEDLIDFYQHEQNWTNRMILGDSLLVMNSLAEKEGLKGQVQMIYIDPPYGIKFGSNWQVSTRKRDVKDGKAEDVTRQPEQIKAFRDTWELRIHSYLSYLRDRLVVAQELLTESGSIFVQIGDENVHLVRCLLDEVFGSENFISMISFQTSGSSPTTILEHVTDFILWYAYDSSKVKYRQLTVPRENNRNFDKDFVFIQSPDGEYRRMKKEEVINPLGIPKGWRRFRAVPCNSQGATEKRTVDFEYQGQRFHPGKDRHWSIDPLRLPSVGSASRLFPIGKSLMWKVYADEASGTPLKSVWLDTSLTGFGESKWYIVQTNSLVIRRCILMTTDPGDLILDPTCGSGTTA
ncbi:site-specific DNA-methyltransferase, partial [Candidatus Poribacteria bacterium]|nr:site-specific DNA-methyltransferase [Candidatus Poribacteria bacterium]